MHQLAALDGVLFVGFSALMWVGGTSLLGVMSGWFALAARYPDRDEAPLRTLRGQSGSMGAPPVSFGNILTLSVCRSGLRIGLLRLFGLFARPVFVPWSDIDVERSSRPFIGPVARLRFGGSEIGRLTVESYVADRLARASEGRWPEQGPFPAEPRSRALAVIVGQWAFISLFAAAAFLGGPALLGGQGPPILVAVLFPAISFGVVSAFRYFARSAD